MRSDRSPINGSAKVSPSARRALRSAGRPSHVKTIGARYPRAKRCASDCCLRSASRAGLFRFGPPQYEHSSPSSKEAVMVRGNHGAPLVEPAPEEPEKSADEAKGEPLGVRRPTRRSLEYDHDGRGGERSRHAQQDPRDDDTGSARIHGSRGY